jgi:hypothetical protein
LRRVATSRERAALVGTTTSVITQIMFPACFQYTHSCHDTFIATRAADPASLRREQRVHAKQHEQHAAAHLAAPSTREQATRQQTAEHIANTHASARAPPRTATARSEIMLAMPRPPATAAPVQTAWPRQPPSVTPTTLLLAARPMVAIWLRSPHSAKKVSVNTSTSTGDSSPARSHAAR